MAHARNGYSQSSRFLPQARRIVGSGDENALRMAVAITTDLGGITNFDIHGDRTTVGARWKKWKRSFKLFVVGKGVQDATQKKSPSSSLWRTTNARCLLYLSGSSRTWRR